MKIILICILFSQITYANSSAKVLSNESLSVDSINPLVSGFYSRINVGFMGGHRSSPSFHIINGYTINTHWSVGLGIGVENFGWHINYIPTFIEGTYNLLKSKTSPWASVMAGYEIPFSYSMINKGGPTFGAKIGFNYFFAKNIGISTSIGYRFAQTRIHADFPNEQGEYILKKQMNRYEFRIGIVLKQ